MENQALEHFETSCQVWQGVAKQFSKGTMEEKHFAWQGIKFASPCEREQRRTHQGRKVSHFAGPCEISQGLAKCFSSRNLEHATSSNSQPLAKFRRGVAKLASNATFRRSFFQAAIFHVFINCKGPMTSCHMSLVPRNYK